jgi:hypothetical protein
MAAHRLAHLPTLLGLIELRGGERAFIPSGEERDLRSERADGAEDPAEQLSQSGRHERAS